MLGQLTSIGSRLEILDRNSILGRTSRKNILVA